MKESWVTRLLFSRPLDVRDLKTQAAVQGWILYAGVLGIVRLLMDKNYGGMLILNVLLVAYAIARSKQLTQWADKLDEGMRIIVEMVEKMGEGLEGLGEKPTEKGD